QITNTIPSLFTRLQGITSPFSWVFGGSGSGQVVVPVLPGPGVARLRSGLLLRRVAAGGGRVTAGAVLARIGIRLVSAARAVCGSRGRLGPAVLDRFLGSAFFGARAVAHRVGSGGGVGDGGLDQGRLGVAGGVSALLVLLTIGRLVITRHSLLP